MEEKKKNLSNLLIQVVFSKRLHQCTSAFQRLNTKCFLMYKNFNWYKLFDINIYAKAQYKLSYV